MAGVAAPDWHRTMARWSPVHRDLLGPDVVADVMRQLRGEVERRPAHPLTTPTVRLSHQHADHSMRNMVAVTAEVRVLDLLIPDPLPDLFPRRWRAVRVLPWHWEWVWRPGRWELSASACVKSVNLPRFRRYWPDDGVVGWSLEWSNDNSDPVWSVSVSWPVPRPLRRLWGRIRGWEED